MQRQLCESWRAPLFHFQNGRARIPKLSCLRYHCWQRHSSCSPDPDTGVRTLLSAVKPISSIYRFLTLLLRAALIVALLVAGWWIYRELPHQSPEVTQASYGETTLQIVLRHPESAAALDIPVELYPVDVVAVRHEYFTERRAGKRFDDFLNERMQGRQTVTAKLDTQGQGIVVVRAGNWWIHARLEGEEELEWRLPVKVAGSKQIVELTSHNVYTRARSF